MHVLNIPGGFDTGGNGWRTKDAFARHAPGWTYDVCTSGNAYMIFPEDRRWVDARALWDAADVVHLRNDFAVEHMLNAPPKPAVVQHHGTTFRTHHEELLAATRRRGAIGLASTLDLWLIAPDELEWLPSPYDIDWLQTFRRPLDDGVLRIAHAPTDREVKSTESFLRAVERLGRQLPVELVLIENATWQDCLRLKGTADVYFDQVTLGYGNNAIEAWGTGLPVVAGAQPDTLEEMEARFGELPFYLADEATIYDALLALADPETRDVWGKRGHAHVRQWHDEAVVVEQLKAVYKRAASTQEVRTSNLRDTSGSAHVLR